MWGTVEFSKQVKKPTKLSVLKDCASQKFITTILETYVTVLTEPNFYLQS